jgi:flavin reductase (DIM6/NTAB) family NADH-FMN oxidoreductase RutF
MLYGELTISMAGASFVELCDYVGIEIAHKVPDKFARSGFHAIKAYLVNATLIEELTFALECKVMMKKNSQ